MANCSTRASHPRARALLPLALGTLIACSDSTDKAHAILQPVAHPMLTATDSANRGLKQRSGRTITSTSGGGGSIVSLTPGNYQGYDQPLTIVGIVSGPVQSVSVSGYGAIKCTGTYGTIIGYDAAGTEVGRQELALIEPADCSPPENPDDVTYGAAGTLQVSNRQIATFEITAMSPLSFPVFSLTGHASATYSIDVQGGPLTLNCPSGLDRGLPITCTAAATDPAQTLAVTYWSFTAATTNDLVERQVNVASQTWSGQLATDGAITVIATVAGAPQTMTVPVTVKARTWARDSSEKDFRIDSPGGLPGQPTGFRGQLGANTPGLPIQTNQFSQWGVNITDDGPNDGYLYLTKYPMKTQTLPAVNTLALRDTSRFYRIQYPKKTRVGTKTFCDRAYVLGIIPLIEQHEGTDPSKFNLVPSNQNKTTTQWNSHSAIFRRYVDSQSNIHVRLEKVAGPSSGLSLTAVLDSIYNEGFALSAAMDDDNTLNVITPQRMGCDDFTYDYTRSQ
jgi:hypothetical protein